MIIQPQKGWHYNPIAAAVWLVEPLEGRHDNAGASGPAIGQRPDSGPQLGPMTALHGGGAWYATPSAAEAWN